ncbi:hypothetical protein LNO75_02790 [Mycoplasma sp. T363T]|nr:hypothetical protein [Mycoplasma bradburyae]
MSLSVENLSKMLKDAKIFQSMSRKGNCLDNAVLKTFFLIIKQEILMTKLIQIMKIKIKIEKFIEYYNEAE